MSNTNAVSKIDAVRFLFVQKKVGSIGKSIYRKEQMGLKVPQEEKETYNEFKKEYDTTKLELEKRIKKLNT